MRILRVFPRKTSHTPIDDMAFVGDPPLLRPEADEVHVSCTFTYDRERAEDLADAWAQYYPVVKLGGPAYGTPLAEFVPGRYIKRGVTFTSRGCDNKCRWCLVPTREHGLRLIPDFAPGHIIQDNNFLACPSYHRHKVYQMLREQSEAAIFAGGLDARLLTDEIADELATLRINYLFLAADTVGALEHVKRAVNYLRFLRLPYETKNGYPADRIRCYVLCAFDGETIEQAEARLEAVWKVGAMPRAQLYQPEDHWIEYSDEWKALARKWYRPAAMRAAHKQPMTALAVANRLWP